MAGFLLWCFVFVVLHAYFLAIAKRESKYLLEVAVVQGALPNDTLKTHLILRKLSSQVSHGKLVCPIEWL